MSRLRSPIRSLLVDLSLDGRELERRSADLLARLQRRRRTVVARWALPAVALLLLLLLATQHRGGNDGPLSLSNRQAIGDLEQLASAASERVVMTSDGSRIVLAPATSLELLENDGQRFDVRLRRGRAGFEVVPGGPRRWIVECGAVTVEVVGTRFAVERARDRIAVEVTHGVVLVRGDSVPGHVQRLAAGEHILVADEGESAVVPVQRPDAPAAAPTEAPEPAAPRPPAHAPAERRSEVLGSHGGSAPTESWRELAHAHRYTEAWAIGARLIATPSLQLSISDLIELADVARFAGSADQAVLVLERASRTYPRDSRAGLAAFTRGRILDGELHQTAEAAGAFAESLALGLPQGLQEEAYARLVEARARVGDWSGARAAATEYDLRFPSGRLRARIDHLVAP